LKPVQLLRANPYGAFCFLLLVIFLLFFPQLFSPTNSVFLGLDAGMIFYPLLHWSSHDILRGHLPLLCDQALHGAPFAAMSPLGITSPLMLLGFTLPTAIAMNLLSALPVALLLFGAFLAGHELKISPSGSFLLAILWTFNGTNMVHLDHIPITWANAFFPWVLICLLKLEKGGDRFWGWSAAAIWGLAIWTGHLQMILFQGFFFLAWILGVPGQRIRRLRDFGGISLGALVLSSPRWLHCIETLLTEQNRKIVWSSGDLFYHSWWPTNIVTLLFPWFFGKFQYDYVNDFWWRYHFNETQVALSITGLFFIGLFFSKPHPRRATIFWAALFGIGMALGEWSPLYRIFSRLPIFSLFRDPGRWWYLATWAFGMAAAYAWDDCFSGSTQSSFQRRWALLLATIPLTLVLALNFLLGPARPSLNRLGTWYIHRFLSGNPGAPHVAGDYLSRLPEKFSQLSRSVDPLQWEVWVPLCIAGAIVVLVFLKKKLQVHLQQFIWLALAVVELALFRMPYGQSLLPLSSISPPAFTAPAGRFLSLSPANKGPYDLQIRGELAFPDLQLLGNMNGFNQHLGRSLPRYEDIDQNIGWFSWVYHDRDSSGWAKRPKLLQSFGIDCIVSDSPFQPPKPFCATHSTYPYTYQIDGIRSKSVWVDQILIAPWPQPLQTPENPLYDPSHMSYLDEPPTFPVSIGSGFTSIVSWSETSVSAQSSSKTPGLIVFQKSYLPGWKVTIDSKNATSVRCDGVLLAVAVPAGEHRIDLRFDPTGLRLGIFFSLLFMASFLFISFSPKRFP
jgi:hypothetical protein